MIRLTEGTRDSLLTVTEGLRKIDRQRNQLNRAIQPSGFVDKIRLKAAGIVKYVPSRRLRQKFEQTPIDRLATELRSNLTDLHGNIGPLIREGQSLLAFHNEVHNIVEQLETPTPEGETPVDRQVLITQLESKLTKIARDDLHLRRDDETDRLIDQVRSSATPEQRQISEGNTLSNARRYLEMSAPTVRATEVTLFATTEAFRNGLDLYGTTLHLREALRLTHTSGRDLSRAIELGVQAPQAIVGEIDLAVSTVQLLIEAIELQRDTRQLRADTDLDNITARSETIIARYRQIMPHPTTLALPDDTKRV